MSITDLFRLNDGGSNHFISFSNLPANGGAEAMAKEVKQFARPNADALLFTSTQVKKIRLLVVTTEPFPRPNDTLHNTKER